MFTKALNFCLTKQRLNRQICDTFIRQTSGTIQQITNSREPAYSSQMITSNKDQVRQQFISLFPMILKDLTDNVKHFANPNLTDWYTRMLEYNVATSNNKHEFLTVLSYKLLADPKKLTPQNIRLAGIMAWCSEVLNASLLVNDDIIDQSKLRRGTTCWYKLPNVGMSAVNDAIVLEKSAYTILRKYFQDHPRYMSMVELFHDSIMKISMGLALEHITSSNLDLFSMDRYRSIVLHKTACFVYQFPVALAMHLAGIDDVELQQQAKAILVELGHWFQVKNDFLDCFGDEETTLRERYGDIREGKCTWPAVVALERATPEQCAIMKRCYGRPDDQSVQAIMEVYTALNMPSLFGVYEAETRTTILAELDHMNPRLAKQVFYNIMDMI